MQLTASNPQYAFAPVMGDPVQQFAGGGVATPQGHDYRYSYDPADQSYTLVGQGNQPSTEAGGVGGLNVLGRLLSQLKDQGVFGPQGQSQPRYTYNPQGQTYTPMASGGAVDAAQQTQNKGRGDDTMLVHMAPSEVKGLQALAMAHGGSLTINPETGLPEAGFLKGILPMLLGGALTVMSGGALSPLMAAGLIGGGTALATGSLKKGLMAGLGAYGGAGMGAGLVGAGATTAAGTEAAANMLGVPQAAGGAASGAGSQAAMLAAENASLGLTPTESLANIGSSAGSATGAVVPSVASQTANLAAAGPSALTTEAGRTGFMQGLKSVPYAGTASTIAGLSAMVPEPPKAGAKPETYIRSYDFAWNPNQQAYASIPKPGDTSERRYFTPTFTPTGVAKAPSDTISQGYTYLPVQTAAGGGLMDLAAGGSPGSQATYTESPKEDQFDDERGVDAYAPGGKVKSRKLTGEDPYSFQTSKESLLDATERNFAAGGLGAVRQTLAPRFLSGGGDGMSDSIKANIDGKQEARLADGEFVVPADVVSHLGNGSSKAGAKKLYAMMDKIRKARTGKERQAPAVRAEKYMPA